MRITAEIIDDDCFAFGPISEKDDQTKELEDFRRDSQKSRKCHSYTIASLLNHPEDVPKNVSATVPLIQHRQKVNEMTQQFRNLHLSDAIAPMVQNKFSLLGNSLTSNTMEKPEGDTSNLLNNLDAAPSWLIQYLLKMKNDIKKEVMEELLTLHQTDPSCSQSGAAGKVDESNLQDVIHYGIFCDNCDQLIHGIRYKCGNCSDFDLCQECESLPNVHNKNHIFLKIRYPVALKLYQKQKLEQLISNAPSGEIYTLSSKNRSLKSFDAKFLSDETIPDGTILPPSTHFVKCWKIKNTGTMAWSHSVMLQHIEDSSSFTPSIASVDIPHLAPGEEGTVSVILISPSIPGTYKILWKFCYKGRTFGHKIWCHIVVKDAEDKKNIETVSAEFNLPVIDIPNEKGIENQRSEVASIEQVLTAVKEEHDRGNMVPRKLAVSSYTATPNNTPFDLTPPKSPDHHETCIKEIQEINSEKASTTKNNDSDDDCSVLSISSSESDTEFVVIPMPKCFDLSESFISHHMPHLAPYLHSESGNKIEKTSVPSFLQGENKYHQNISKRAETVSQETGVPELSEHIEKHSAIDETDYNQESEKKILISHVTADGSSSEISIIESDDDSPTVENMMPTIDSISIAVSNEIDSKPNFVCEVKYPILEAVKDNSSPKQTLLNQEYENEELESQTMSSTTFPKFPVEGITNAYEPPLPNHNHEERTIQVLPEGLVTGALCAAASMYNTARAVISTMQQPRNERGTCLSQDPPVVPDIPQEQSLLQLFNLKPMDQLVEMGFCNRQQNEQLLIKHNGDVALVVEELVNLNDNEWYASRHIPSPP